MADQVFISYRRDDTAGYAGRVHDRLVREFGGDLLFIDVDAVPLGLNFVEVIREKVASCGVLLAVIGPNWIDARDAQGKRRLEDPNDFVRIEIAAALQRKIPVVPILIGAASVPRIDQLPDDLKELSLRNALEVRHASFHSDMDKLIRGIRTQFGWEDKPGPTRLIPRSGGNRNEPKRAQDVGQLRSKPLDAGDLVAHGHVRRAKVASNEKKAWWGRATTVAVVLVVGGAIAAGTYFFLSGGFGARIDRVKEELADANSLSAALKQKDYAEALRLAKPLAEKGNKEAQFSLGWLYDKGSTVEHNELQAASWYRKAAEQGHLTAQYNLALMYENGYGVERNYEEALNWFRKAAEQGDAAAQNDVGYFYFNGLGTKKDYFMATTWFQKAATQNLASAQKNLGDMYADGQAGRQDDAEAVRWYRLAAEQGHEHAMFKLASHYENGRGVPRNNKVALDWYGRAANKGLFRARRAAADLLREQRNFPEALKAYRAAFDLCQRGAKDCNDQEADIADKTAGLSDDAVKARDFSVGLEAVDFAISIAPEETWYYGNRANALMFLGRVEEARSLYLQHRGKKDVVGDKSWETTVLDDFAELRKLGLTHPLMAEIEKRFSARK